MASSTTTSPPTATISPLFRLPRELRDMIWSEVLHMDMALDCTQEPLSVSWRWLNEYLRSILHVSKRVRYEALMVFPRKLVVRNSWLLASIVQLLHSADGLSVLREVVFIWDHLLNSWEAEKVSLWLRRCRNLRLNIIVEHPIANLLAWGEPELKSLQPPTRLWELRPDFAEEHLPLLLFATEVKEEDGTLVEIESH